MCSVVMVTQVVVLYKLFQLWLDACVSDCQLASSSRSLCVLMIVAVFSWWAAVLPSRSRWPKLRSPPHLSHHHLKGLLHSHIWIWTSILLSPFCSSGVPTTTEIICTEANDEPNTSSPHRSPRTTSSSNNLLSIYCIKLATYGLCHHSYNSTKWLFVWQVNTLLMNRRARERYMI